MKRYTCWKNTVGRHIFDEKIVPKIYKEFFNSITTKLQNKKTKQTKNHSKNIRKHTSLKKKHEWEISTQNDSYIICD